MADGKVCDICNKLITDVIYYQVPEANVIELATMKGYEPANSKAKDIHSTCMASRSSEVCILITANADAVYASK